MPIREEIKSILAKENLTMSDLAEKISEKTGKNCSLQSISQRLLRGTLTFNDAEVIAEILGYDLKFKKK
jgi:hypothetical protein